MRIVAPPPPPPWLQIRDVDLDTLEKVTSIIAYGDIEAEDTRHLTEMNFIKVRRGVARRGQGAARVQGEGPPACVRLPPPPNAPSPSDDEYCRAH